MSPAETDIQDSLTGREATKCVYVYVGIFAKKENEDQKPCYILGGTEEQLQKSYWNTWGDKEGKLFQKTCWYGFSLWKKNFLRKIWLCLRGWKVSSSSGKKTFPWEVYFLISGREWKFLEPFLHLVVILMPWTQNNQSARVAYWWGGGWRVLNSFNRNTQNHWSRHQKLMGAKFFWHFNLKKKILSTPCGFLVPWPGIIPNPSGMEIQNLNHWMVKEVPN